MKYDASRIRIFAMDDKLKSGTRKCVKFTSLFCNQETRRCLAPGIPAADAARSRVNFSKPDKYVTHAGALRYTPNESGKTGTAAASGMRRPRQLRNVFCGRRLCSLRNFASPDKNGMTAEEKRKNLTILGSR